MTVPTNWKSICVAGILLLVALVPLIVCLYRTFAAKRNRRLKSPWLWTGMSVVGVVAAVVVGGLMMFIEANRIVTHCHRRLCGIRQALGKHGHDVGTAPESLGVLVDKGYLHKAGDLLCWTTGKPFRYRTIVGSDRRKCEITCWDPYDHGLWVPFYDTDFDSYLYQNLTLDNQGEENEIKELKDAVRVLERIHAQLRAQQEKGEVPLRITPEVYKALDVSVHTQAYYDRSQAYRNLGTDGWALRYVRALLGIVSMTSLEARDLAATEYVEHLTHLLQIKDGLSRSRSYGNLVLINGVSRLVGALAAERVLREEEFSPEIAGVALRNRANSQNQMEMLLAEAWQEAGKALDNQPEVKGLDAYGVLRAYYIASHAEDESRHAVKAQVEKGGLSMLSWQYALAQYGYNHPFLETILKSSDIRLLVWHAGTTNQYEDMAVFAVEIRKKVESPKSLPRSRVALENILGGERIAQLGFVNFHTGAAYTVFEIGCSVGFYYPGQRETLVDHTLFSFRPTIDKELDQRDVSD